MSDQTSTETPDLKPLLNLIKTLRGENGCPWDKKQTPETMITYLIEEVYELLHAIKSEDPHHILDELGDVFFQLLFIVVLYQEKKQLTLNDVIHKNIEKMKRRHPHVYGDVHADSVEIVKKNWDLIKADEKNGAHRSLIDSVPSGLPSLQRAYLISERVGKAGFDWDNIKGVIEKVEEEWKELHEALEENHVDNISLEFGDLLFTLTNIARFAGIHPETALAGSINKFETRYKHMEQVLLSSGKDLLSISRHEIDLLWERAKKDTK